MLIPGRDFQANLSTSGFQLSIGVCNVWLGRSTPEKKALFGQATKSLSSIITAEDIEVPLHKRADHDDIANVMMTHGLKAAWAEYLSGVDGPMKNLQDVVNWHSEHPVSFRTEAIAISRSS